MTDTGMGSEDRLYLTRAFYIVAAITLIRVIVLIVSPLELYPDEAQYWFWAQTPALGYFSKPPVIGWIIWFTTSLFGNAEWAIRIASPFFHAGTALLIFGIGRIAFDARTGFWSALAYLTVPGVSYSCGLASTDVPLLFFWAAALYAFLRASTEPGWRWPLICGIAFGWGLMAKYAMLYFVLSAVLAAFLVPALRRLVYSTRGLAILVLGLLILAPNIAWNAANGFPTVAHTEANADWGSAHFQVTHIFAFLGGQFGVFGPLLMVGFILALWGMMRARPDGKALILMSFAVPPIVLMTAQAFISEANANWAATAYVAATPLAVAVLLQHYRRMLLWASFAVNGLVMVVLWAIYISPPFADVIGLGNAFKRMEGWRTMATQVMQTAEAGGYDAVATANRSVVAELVYYARASKVPIRMWGPDSRAHDHFQMTIRLTPLSDRVLLAILPKEEDTVLPAFDSVGRLRTIDTPIGGHHMRTILLFDARGYRGPPHSGGEGASIIQRAQAIPRGQGAHTATL